MRSQASSSFDNFLLLTWRRTITPVPITPVIITHVHVLAALEQVPEGLKMSNRTGKVFYDSAWIAGVDYNNEPFEDDRDKDYINNEQGSSNKCK